MQIRRRHVFVYIKGPRKNVHILYLSQHFHFVWQVPLLTGIVQ
jgi:hypothetical protein